MTDEAEPRNFLRYCPHCGSQRFEAHSTKEFVCGACGFDFFVNSAAAVVALITDAEGRLLLTTRARNPQKGMLDLPGGFVDPGESAETALRREVREELQTEIETISYLGSAPNRYVFSNYAVQTTDLAFACSLSGTPQPSDDVATILFLHHTQIDLDKIAFASIRYFIEHYHQ